VDHLAAALIILDVSVRLDPLAHLRLHRLGQQPLGAVAKNRRQDVLRARGWKRDRTRGNFLHRGVPLGNWVVDHQIQTHVRRLLQLPRPQLSVISLLLAICIVGSCLWGCTRPTKEQVADSGSPPEDELAGTSYGEFIIGDSISHENLTVFPILSKTPKNDDRFITLDEGLAAGSVQVIEVGAKEGNANVADGPDPFGAGPQLPENGNAVARLQDGAEDADAGNPLGYANQESAEQEAAEAPEGIVEVVDDSFGGGEIDGDVNTLMVLNTSGKPLYIMLGEVISGGNQDRTIGQETVIASSEKPVLIDVFCVERGRWGSRSLASFTSQLTAAGALEENLSVVVSSTVAVEELAKEAQRGKFVASVG
jgi:ARG and Rhodanese-Phosphatase-superfamily-associated Protein domain